MIRSPWLAALALLVAGNSLAQTPRPAALSTYEKTLAAVERAKRPTSLQPLLAAAEAAQDVLMSLEADGNHAWLETLSDAEYDALRASLRGIHLSRGYDIYAQPDPDFLFALAERHGLPEDRAFFQRYRDFWSAELMPRYLSAGNSPTPCVRFGEGILPELYANWRSYAQAYPQAYTAFTQQVLRDLEEAVALGVCSCGDEKTVERELGGFLKRFPDMPGTASIELRLKELREDPDLRPVRCR